MLFSGLLNSAPVRAEVLPVQTSGTTVTSGGAAHGAPLFAPYGVAGLPPEGDGALLLPLDGAYACAGFLCDTTGLQPGEVRLRASSGAEILLLQNGDIRLNGLTITAQGQIIPKGGA